MSISASVGRNGVNRRDDVGVVQRLINKNIGLLTPLRELKEDRRIGPATIGAIEEFQRRVCQMRWPDGRVDPKGRTLRLLEKSAAKPVRQPAQPDAPATGRTGIVIYKSGMATEERIVSSYTFEVVKLALADAAMEKAVITSTIRTPQRQARIMYDNAVKNLAAQKRLYGPTGDQVLKVYEENRDKSRDVVIGLMADKIEELLEKGRRTSLHCVTRSVYDRRNIIDIGVNSTRSVCPSFDLERFTGSLRTLNQKGFIARFIDETDKSNNCWHLEVVPDRKPLPT